VPTRAGVRDDLVIRSQAATPPRTHADYRTCQCLAVTGTSRRQLSLPGPVRSSGVRQLRQPCAGAQIVQFGCCSGGQSGERVADQIGGYARVPLRSPRGNLAGQLATLSRELLACGSAAGSPRCGKISRATVTHRLGSGHDHANDGCGSPGWVAVLPGGRGHRVLLAWNCTFRLARFRLSVTSVFAGLHSA
jgi:hypothetical protein